MQMTVVQPPTNDGSTLCQIDIAVRDNRRFPKGVDFQKLFWSGELRGSLVPFDLVWNVQFLLLRRMSEHYDRLKTCFSFAYKQP